MVRRQRRWVAGLMTLGLAFAQFVTVSHACTFAGPVSLTAPTLEQPVDEPMPSDCAAMAGHTAANAHVCQLHCTYGQQIDVHPDAPVAAIAPQRALTVRVTASSGETTSLTTTFLGARSTAPPVSLLFSRFLI